MLNKILTLGKHSAIIEYKFRLEFDEFEKIKTKLGPETLHKKRELLEAILSSRTNLFYINPTSRFHNKPFFVAIQLYVVLSFIIPGTGQLLPAATGTGWHSNGRIFLDVTSSRIKITLVVESAYVSA